MNIQMSFHDILTRWRISRIAWKTFTEIRIRNLNLYRDQRGMESIQVVMILAISAVVLLFVKNWWWPWVEEFCTLAIEILLEN